MATAMAAPHGAMETGGENIKVGSKGAAERESEGEKAEGQSQEEQNTPPHHTAH